MKNIKYLLLAAMFGAAVFSSCKKDDDKTPATKPVITLEAGEAEGSYKVAVKSDSDLTSVVVKTKAGDEEKTAADVKTFTNAKEYTFEGVVEFPAKVYAAVVTVTATNKKDLSNTQELQVNIPEPKVDPDAPVLYNWAREFVTVSRKAWNENHAAGKIKQHTEAGGLIEDDVHYIPDEWSDPEEEGKWTKFHVAGKTYNTADMMEIATRAYLMLQGYDAATKVEGGGWNGFDKLPVPATMSAEIPETHGFKWGAMTYNESGVTKVGGEMTANGGPIRFGDILKGTAGAQANVCRQDIMTSYAQRHLIWPFTHDMVMSNMCGYTNANQRAQVNNEFFGTVCGKRFYMMMVGFFEYMVEKDLMDVSTIPADQLFDCTLYGNEKWD